MRHVPKNQSVFQTVNSPMSIAWVFIALLVIELGCSSNPHSALHQHVATWESLAIQDKGEVVGQLTDAIEKTKSGNGFLIRVKVGSGNDSSCVSLRVQLQRSNRLEDASEYCWSSSQPTVSRAVFRSGIHDWAYGPDATLMAEF